MVTSMNTTKPNICYQRPNGFQVMVQMLRVELLCRCRLFLPEEGGGKKSGKYVWELLGRSLSGCKTRCIMR